VTFGGLAARVMGANKMVEAIPVGGGNSMTPTRRRHWRWFFAGFLILFAGLLLLYPVHFYDGRAVYETKLWRYYQLAFRQQWNSSGNAGPTSGNFAVLLRTAFLHVAVATLGGVAAVVAARVLRRDVPRT
jgi:hypothetical protein